MLGNGNVPVQSQQSTQILTQISEDICQGTDVGEDIKPELAKIINNLWKSKMPAEKLKAKLNQFMRPGNCVDSMKVLKCNGDIWSHRGQLKNAENAEKDEKGKKVVKCEKSCLLNKNMGKKPL